MRSLARQRSDASATHRAYPLVARRAGHWTRASARLANLALASSLCTLAACSTILLPNYDAAQAREASEEHEDRPQILFAQGSATETVEGTEQAWLTFDRTLDPNSLRAFNFVLVFSDDTRAYPSAVHLAGADRGYDARSLVVEGDLRSAKGLWRLVRVQIVGPVYSADGHSLRGSSVGVAAPGAPRAVMAHRLAEASSASDCEGQWVRVYFSDAVISSSSTQSPEDGATKHQATDRGALESQRPSNRIDLCQAKPGPVEVKSGIVRGSDKSPNPSATLALEGAP